MYILADCRRVWHPGGPCLNLNSVVSSWLEIRKSTEHAKVAAFFPHIAGAADAIIPRPVTQIESRLFGLLFCTQSKNGHVRVVACARSFYIMYGASARVWTEECFLRD